MIRLLNGTGAALPSLPRPCWSECRVKAVAKAWGMERDFIRFYANEDGSLVIGEENGFAVPICRDEAARAQAEAFLPLITEEVCAEARLSLPGFTEETGCVYERAPFPGERLPGVTEELTPAYSLLAEVFPDRVKPENHKTWYADLSHRVRHGMSRVYTLPGIVSGTGFCVENGLLTVAQLGVAPAERGKGWGKRMLAHLCAVHAPFDRLILLSRDGESDRFYERQGFTRTAEWFYYSPFSEEKGVKSQQRGHSPISYHQTGGSP